MSNSPMGDSIMGDFINVETFTPVSKIFTPESHPSAAGFN